MRNKTKSHTKYSFKMVKDRLADIQKLCNNSSNIDKKTIINIEPTSTELEIIVILSKFTKIRQLMQAIRENIEKMRTYMQTISNSYQASVEKSLSKNMEKIRFESISVGQKICFHMENLKNDLSTPDDENVAARINRFQLYSVQEEFFEIWKQYELFLLDYEKRVKMKLQRTAKIANQNLTEAEIEVLVANNNTSLFVENYLEKREMEENKLRELQDNFVELRKIEQSLIQVHEIFLQLSTSVMKQDSSIRRIEDIVLNTKSNMEATINSLNQAADSNNKGFKCKTYIILGIMLFFVITSLFLLC